MNVWCFYGILKRIFFIIGDLNLPHIDWEPFDSPEDQIHSVFLDFCLKFGLNQFVNESTLCNNTLHLVLSTIN